MKIFLGILFCASAVVTAHGSNLWVASIHDGSPPVNPGESCDCSGSSSDCICALIFVGAGEHSANGTAEHVTTRALASHALNGTVLTLRLRDKAPWKSHTFTQKTELPLSPADAKELGYVSLTILPGNYAVENNAIAVKIRKGAPIPPAKR